MKSLGVTLLALCDGHAVILASGVLQEERRKAQKDVLNTSTSPVRAVPAHGAQCVCVLVAHLLSALGSPGAVQVTLVATGHYGWSVGNHSRRIKGGAAREVEQAQCQAGPGGAARIR